MSIFKKGFAAMGRRKRRERGIALIFTLGILGLLTVLALGFASTAMLNSKISGNISHQQKARYIARLGAERALYALTQCPDIPISNIFSKSFVSHSGETEEERDREKLSCDGIWKLNTKLNGIPIYEITDDYGADSVGWEYIRDPQSVTEEDIKKDIIGRYAYVVVEEIGKLDPSVHMHTTDIASLSRNGGKDIANELSFGVPLATSFFPNTCADNLTNLNGLVTLAKNFQTHYSRRLFNLGNLLEYKADDSDNDSTKKITAFQKLDYTTPQKKAKLKRALKSILGSRLEPYQECYTLSSTSTESSGTTTTNTYPRFNLNRDDWDSLTPEELVNPANLSSGNAIAWLVNWTHSRGTTDEWTAERMKKQIAANIIQYCKDENVVTVTDLSSESEWSPDNFPKYAGVGRHPMLNEIGVKLNIKADAGEQPVGTDETMTTYEPRYTIAANIGAELIDIFGLSSYKDAEVSFYGKLSFEYTVPKYNGSVFTCEEADNVTHNIGELDITKFNQTVSLEDWAQGYSGVWTNASGSDLITATISIGSFVAPKDEADQVLANMKVRKIRLHIDTVILKYNNVSRDCARISKTDKDGSYTDLVDYRNGPRESENPEKRKDYYEFSEQVTEYSFQAAWQAVDPRVNHYPIDWTLKLSEPTETEYPGTMGEKNTFDGYVDDTTTYTAPNAVTDGDKEAVSDPAWTSSGHLASAYIRHAPMESLWELGCISRAEPWKTLNLKKSRVFASGETQGGGEYAKGDANILDQVTLTDKKSRFGLINLNTDEHFVLETLFYQIPFHTELHQTGIGADDKSILGATGTSSIYPVYSKKDTSNHNKEESCLACLIMERSKILRFEKRSDLLMDETEVDALTTIDSGKKSSLKETVTKLRTALFSIPKTGESASPEEETSSKTTDAEEEQLVGKIMNLVAADPYETVYIIAVGQSIRDIGSSDENDITIFKNWAGSGKADKTYKDNAVTKGNDAYKAYRRAGYIRPSTLKEIEDGDSSPKVLNGAPNQLEDEITGVKKGQYDLGADKISAESKIVMTLCFDPWTKKWKIKRFEYVE